MQPKDKYSLMLETYSNPTKMKIILLLAENEEMTVTQMASHIAVSRSNLYHFVKQMVKDGILNNPSVRPKDNYVEKYHSLNQDFFSTIQLEALRDHFNTMSTDEIRNLFRSLMMGYSFNFMMLADKLGNAESETLEKFKEAYMNHNAIVINSYTHMGNYPLVEEYLRKAMEEFEKPSADLKDNPRLRIMILSLPYI